MANTARKEYAKTRKAAAREQGGRPPAVVEVTRRIPEGISNILWGRAAGRCEFAGCNRELWKSKVTQELVNLAQKAHIYSFSPDGPRSNKGIPTSKLNSLRNLMLVCHECHQKIDREKDGGRYSAKLLQAMKLSHENRVKLVTSIDPSRSSHVLHYSASIDGNPPILDFQETGSALFPIKYPADDIPIIIGNVRSAVKDSEQSFWSYEEESLRKSFGQDVKPRLLNGTGHLSVFALAPQPLLIVLGTLLTELNGVDVYAHHKQSPRWEWRSRGPKINFAITRPQRPRSSPALILSISGRITNDRVLSVLDKPASIWRVDIDTPQNDCLKTREQLSDFRTAMRKIIDAIKSTHGQRTELKIFPALPAAMAVELGRIRQPKADQPWKIYDQNNSRGGFIPATTISTE